MILRSALEYAEVLRSVYLKNDVDKLEKSSKSGHKIGVKIMKATKKNFLKIRLDTLEERRKSDIVIMLYNYFIVTVKLDKNIFFMFFNTTRTRSHKTKQKSK